MIGLYATFLTSYLRCRSRIVIGVFIALFSIVNTSYSVEISDESTKASTLPRLLLRANCHDQSEDYCVIGSLPLGTKVTLLSRRESKICESLSIRTSTYVSEGSGKSISLTHISPHGCEPFQFQLAYRKSNRIRYKVEDLQPISDSKTVQKIDGDIRRQKHLIENNSGEHRTQLSDAAPRVLLIPHQKESAHIVAYENKLLQNEDTYVFYSRSTIKKIHGAARINSVFSINDRIFVHYKFSCTLGCGWRGDFVISIDENDFQIELFDDSWSS